MKEYEEKYWASRSKQYNSTNWVKNTSFMNAFLSLLPQYNFQNILEIGIGTGVVALEMINRVQKITGIDISQEMIDKINHDGITPIVANAHNLPFEDESFELIYMRNVIHYIDDPKKVFSEIYRCLKPGGQFLFSQVVPPDDSISKEYDWLVGRDIHYPTKSEILGLFSPFHSVKQDDFVLEKQSIMNWLNNTCQSEDEKATIIERHRATSAAYRLLSNYEDASDDIFVDIRHFMISGKR